jgi:hypothetical protein
VPEVSIGSPLTSDGFDVTEVEGIKVYYAPNLEVKEGYTHINIKLKKLFFWGWLEVAGVKHVAVYE